MAATESPRAGRRPPLSRIRTIVHASKARRAISLDEARTSPVDPSRILDRSVARHAVGSHAAEFEYPDPLGSGASRAFTSVNTCVAGPSGSAAMVLDEPRRSPSTATYAQAFASTVALTLANPATIASFAAASTAIG